MRKSFLILITVIFFNLHSHAGNKQIKDTTSIIEEEEYTYDEIESGDTIGEYQNRFSKNYTADTSLYFNNLNISPDSIAALKNAKEFRYIKTLDSLLRNEKEKPVKKIKRKRKNNFLQYLFSSKLIKVILWGIGISFVVFLLYRLFLADGIFKRPSRKNKTMHPEVQEEIITSNSDFDFLIVQALQNNNFRLAVRYNYLKSLHILSENEFVQIAPDKTNFQYVREINNYEYQNKFSSLTLHYEYVWYGEFNINETVYKKIVEDFNKFNKNFN